MQSIRREVKYYAGGKIARERLQIRLIPRGGRGDRADHEISPLRTSVLPRLLRFFEPPSLQRDITSTITRHSFGLGLSEVSSMQNRPNTIGQIAHDGRYPPCTASDFRPRAKTLRLEIS